MSADAVHGTTKQYDRGCRCSDCRKANSARHRGLRAERLRRAALGQLPESLRHGVSVARNWGCRCDTCSTALQEANSELRARAKDRGIRHVRGGSIDSCPCESCRAGVSRRQKAANDSSRPTAHRAGFHWTGPELELADRSDLTAEEVAKMLGRTRYAVSTARHRIAAKDPKTLFLLSAPTNS